MWCFPPLASTSSSLELFIKRKRKLEGICCSSLSLGSPNGRSKCPSMTMSWCVFHFCFLLSKSILPSGQCLRVCSTCFNHNNSGSKAELETVFFKKKVKYKKIVSFYQNKNKMCYWASSCGGMVIIYCENCNCAKQCYFNGKEQVTKGREYVQREFFLNSSLLVLPPMGFRDAKWNGSLKCHPCFSLQENYIKDWNYIVNYLPCCIVNNLTASNKLDFLK